MHLSRSHATGKADHTGGASDLFQSPRDLILLGAHSFWREHAVELRVRVAAQRCQKAAQFVVALAARVAVAQVFCRRRIRGVAAPFRVVAVDEPFILKVGGTNDHGCPPSSARSFRAARNRWTRTVDSLSPIMAPTSRGVQSP